MGRLCEGGGGACSWWSFCCCCCGMTVLSGGVASVPCNVVARVCLEIGVGVAEAGRPLAKEGLVGRDGEGRGGGGGGGGSCLFRAAFSATSFAVDGVVGDGTESSTSSSSSSSSSSSDAPIVSSAAVMMSSISTLLSSRSSICWCVMGGVRADNVFTLVMRRLSAHTAAADGVNGEEEGICGNFQISVGRGGDLYL